MISLRLRSCLPSSALQFSLLLNPSRAPANPTEDPGAATTLPSFGLLLLASNRAFPSLFRRPLCMAGWEARREVPGHALESPAAALTFRPRVSFHYSHVYSVLRLKGFFALKCLFSSQLSLAGCKSPDQERETELSPVLKSKPPSSLRCWQPDPAQPHPCSAPGSAAAQHHPSLAPGPTPGHALEQDPPQAKQGRIQPAQLSAGRGWELPGCAGGDEWAEGAVGQPWGAGSMVSELSSNTRM